MSLIDEQSSRTPSDLYALMHTARELMLEQACRAGRIPYCVLRPCAIYGSGDTHNSYGPNRFLKTALGDGIIRLFGEGEERRDHVYIHDVIRVVQLCLFHGSAGTVNIASGEVISFGDLARLLAKTLDRPVAIQPQPRSGPVTHRHFDNTPLIRAFPMATAARESR
jgi:nucleoside-diphosphate-sugar epimerase